jgi:hypothetical protein
MTRRDQIIIRLEQVLTGITKAGGYNTDAGLSVHRELQYTEHPDVMPSIAWFGGECVSGNDGDVPPSMGEENHLWAISIEGFIPDDLNGAAGESLRTDIVRAIRSDYTLAGLCEPIENIRSSVAVSAGDDIFSTVQVGMTIFYVTAYGAAE